MTVISATTLLSCNSAKENSSVIIYPAVGGLVTCTDLTIEAGGKQIWVENLKRPIPENAPDWFRSVPATRNMEVNIASFGCSGPFELTIKVNRDVSSITVRPKSKKIPFTKKGNTFSLQSPGACKLYIEIDSMPPLLVFADSIETDTPVKGDENIRIFGPGMHNPGAMTLKDNEQIYIAAGAIVYGAISGSPKGAKVFGRGILDGSKLKQSGINLNRALDVEFNGVTLRCGSGWQNTLSNCDRITYRNVKVLSFVPYGDGIDPVSCRDITIDNCFFRCSDDCISVKASKMGETEWDRSSGPDVADITVSNCVMAGYTFSDGFTIGFETNATSIKNVMVKTCDSLCAQGGNKIGGHSAFSIICDGPAKIENIMFEDIRVEENVLKLFELNVSDGQIYTMAPPGSIKGVRLKNIQWAREAPIILWGLNETHLVDDITFEGCTIAGEPFEGLGYRQLKINKFVKNIKISNQQK
jgi:polygalacturonase